MLTPLDIENKEFKKEMRGYSIAEVNSFMDEIVGDYDKLYQDNAVAKQRIKMLIDAVKQYKAMEETLQNAMTIARGAGDEVKQNAYNQAELIIKDAQAKAEMIINDAQKEVEKINLKYKEMQRSIEVFKARMLSLLNSQLGVLKEYTFVNSSADKDISEKKNEVGDIQARAAQGADEALKRNRSLDLKNAEVMQNLEDVTQELPKLELDDNGQYVIVKDEDKK